VFGGEDVDDCNKKEFPLHALELNLPLNYCVCVVCVCVCVCVCACAVCVCVQMNGYYFSVSPQTAGQLRPYKTEFKGEYRYIMVDFQAR